MTTLALIACALALGCWLIRLVPKRPAVRDEEEEMHLRYIRSRTYRGGRSERTPEQEAEYRADLRLHAEKDERDDDDL